MLSNDECMYPWFVNTNAPWKRRWWVELWLLMTIGNVWTRGGRRRAGLDMEWEMGTKLKAASNHNAEERWKHPKREWWSRTYARCVMHVNLPLSLLLPIIFDYTCTGSCHRYILLVSHNPSESTNLAKWKYISNVGTKSNHQLAESLFYLSFSTELSGPKRWSTDFRNNVPGSTDFRRQMTGDTYDKKGD